MESAFDLLRPVFSDSKGLIKEVFWASVPVVESLEENFRLAIIRHLGVQIKRLGKPKIRWGRQCIKIAFSCPEKKLDQASAIAMGIYNDYNDAAPKILIDGEARWLQRPKPKK